MAILTVNNQPIEIKLESDTPLLWALRDAANLTGSKYGCGTGECGACEEGPVGPKLRFWPSRRTFWERGIRY